jgi:hypothetical protein
MFTYLSKLTRKKLFTVIILTFLCSNFPLHFNEQKIFIKVMTDMELNDKTLTLKILVFIFQL